MKPVIGMEIHVELATQSKMFCGCPQNHFGVEPNTHTCPVCLGMPGALPVPNKKAVDWTIMLGLALGSTIAENSKFDRKHYFYPDLPKGYQISQYDEPLCTGGSVDTSYGKIGITRIHLEEDTAKLQHQVLEGSRVSLVDFNRSSVPLMEIVTDPDITSGKQAKEYAQKIQQIVRYLEISDADMEKGSMRVEANISWGLDLGYKVEVKNINSFKFLEKAIDFELARQKELLDAGVTPDQETRGWNESKNQTVSQRSKEDAKDYRYFPEPDIPPMVFTQTDIDQIRRMLPELPQVMKSNLINTWGIRSDYADILVTSKSRSLAVIECLKQAKSANLDTDEVIKLIINKNMDPADPEKIFTVLQTRASKSGLSDAVMSELIHAAITENPDVVEKYRAGKTAVIGVLVGDVMKRSKGQADPKQVNALLTQSLRINP